MFVRIPETIVHKYACHVWQKIFEIRWVTSPPAVMAHVHGALKGRWAQIALDETGSLAIQNIFENLTEPEKVNVGMSLLHERGGQIPADIEWLAASLGRSVGQYSNDCQRTMG